MLLELVWSQPPKLHPIRWMAEAGDASFETPAAAPLPAQFVNVPVSDQALQQAVDDGLAGLNLGETTQVFITPVDGQTVFPLGAVAQNPATIVLWINGQRFRSPSFQVIGDTIVWQSEFTISSSDMVEIEFK